MTDNLYDAVNPITEIHKHTSDNSCQVYVNNNDIVNSKLNMNFFRNIKTRFNGTKPNDLTLSIKHSFTRPNQGAANFVEQSMNNIFVSKYRGRYYALELENAIKPLLYSIDNNTFRFININQFTPNEALKNLSKQGDRYQIPTSSTLQQFQFTAAQFGDNSLIRINSGTTSDQYVFKSYRNSLNNQVISNTSQVIFDTHFLNTI